MRYFVVTYIQKPRSRHDTKPRFDEVVEVTTRVRNRDISMSSVILDFRDMQVIKCSISGQLGSRDWNTVHDYYLTHYRNVFDQLHQENGRKIIEEVSAPESTSDQV